MDDELNGRNPQWKTASMDVDINRKQSYKKTHLQENKSGRRPYWKRTLACLASQFCSELGAAQPHLVLLNMTLLKLWCTHQVKCKRNIFSENGNYQCGSILLRHINVVHVCFCYSTKSFHFYTSTCRYKILVHIKSRIMWQKVLLDCQRKMENRVLQKYESTQTASQFYNVFIFKSICVNPNKKTW